MVCCIYPFIFSFLLLITKFYQDKIVKKYIKGDYFYSSDLLKSQIKILLKDFQKKAKYILNAYFFMMLSILIVMFFTYALNKYYKFEICHPNGIFLGAFAFMTLFIGIQFYLEYYKFILPVAEEALTFFEIRKKMGEPISLDMAIEKTIIAKEEDLKLISLKKFLKIYNKFNYDKTKLTNMSNEDIEYFKNHSSLAGFLINDNYEINYIKNQKILSEDQNSKVYFLKTSKENKALIISESKFKPFLNIVQNEKKQQLINLLDVFVVSILLFFAYC